MTQILPVGCGHEHHHHHHADEVFTSWGQETVKTFTKEQIEGILKKLSDHGRDDGARAPRDRDRSSTRHHDRDDGAHAPHRRL